MEFEKRLQETYGLPDNCIRLLLEHLEKVSCVKKEIIITEGQKEDYIYFVEQGSVRGHILRDGKYVTIFFAFEGDVAGSTLSLTTKTPAKVTMEALENSILLRISKNQMERLFEQSVELANWGRKLAEKVLTEYLHYFIDYYWTDKSTQYQNIIKEYPQLLQRISLKELASYLNVTPQTLSRIRANVK